MARLCNFLFILQYMCHTDASKYALDEFPCIIPCAIKTDFPDSRMSLNRRTDTWDIAEATLWASAPGNH
jgi:hypothetical protein